MRILYVSTISNTMSFFVPHIEMLVEAGHIVDMACAIQMPIPERLINLGCHVHEISFTRKPLSRGNIKAIQGLRDLIICGKYDIVHTHTPNASVCVRWVCRKTKSVKVIYTAHGFHFYIGAPILNWLVYYPIERFLARYTDVLITVNKEDYRCARKFKARKVEYIPGVGVNTEKFANTVIDRAAKRSEIGIPDEAVVLMSVGELNKNKNHQVIIRALAELKNEKIHYVIVGSGILHNSLISLSKKLRVDDKLHFLGFRQDVHEIYKAADIYCHPSLREGLPVALIEATAAGLPCVVSLIRGNSDIVEKVESAYPTQVADISGFAWNISAIIQQNNAYMYSNKYDISKVKLFDIKCVLSRYMDIYNTLTKASFLIETK